jgi:hypothetical protein
MVFRKNWPPDSLSIIWIERQAALLRRRAAGELIKDVELDWLNLAEEIEAVGSNTRRDLRHGLARLLQHLPKCHYQPELRSRSWRAAIRTRRQEIEDLLADNPSLRPRLPEFLLRYLPAARADALEGNKPARSARIVAVHHRAGTWRRIA